jgi:hypothetical protein
VPVTLNQVASGEECRLGGLHSALTIQRRRDRGEGAIFVLDDEVNVTPQR